MDRNAVFMQDGPRFGHRHIGMEDDQEAAGRFLPNGWTDFVLGLNCIGGMGGEGGGPGSIRLTDEVAIFRKIAHDADVLESKLAAVGGGERRFELQDRVGAAKRSALDSESGSVRATGRTKPSRFPVERRGCEAPTAIAAATKSAFDLVMGSLSTTPENLGVGPALFGVTIPAGIRRVVLVLLPAVGLFADGYTIRTFAGSKSSGMGEPQSRLSSATQRALPVIRRATGTSPTLWITGSGRSLRTESFARLPGRGPLASRVTADLARRLN